MNKVYVPVRVEDELPETDWKGIVIREDGSMYKAAYYVEKGVFWHHQFVPDKAGNVTHWLKETPIPTQEEINEAVDKFDEDPNYRHSYMLGIETMLIMINLL